MRFDEIAPLHMVIVDEASQIEVGDYIPLLQKSAKTLEKLVFIGDDKQRAQSLSVTCFTLADSPHAQLRRSDRTKSRISRVFLNFHIFGRTNCFWIRNVNRNLYHRL